ncbi:MAG: glycosyl transferase [Pseudomonadota bacterium]
MTSAEPLADTGRPPIRVCFFFNAQRHQVLHGISTAVELARRPGFEAHVVSPSEGHLDYAREVAGRLGGAPIVFTRANPLLLSAIAQMTGGAVPPKVLTLGLLARDLNRFEAIAVPERTSILLRKLGARSPRYIHLDHGAGDRAAGFDPRIREFDMVLMAGEKHRARMAEEGLIHPGRHAVVGYPKFEAADAMRDPAWRPFDNRRPTVLYNPHFSRLGSWEAFGEAVLQAFAGQDRYNLIVAPHVRMLDGHAQQAKWRALAEAYAGHAHIRIDLGSERCIDMTYTALADVYLGDVSSQVYEFLRTPKPCVFLDGHGVDWEGDKNYGHWRFGPVERSPARVLETVDAAVASHWRYLDVQIDGFAETFAEPGTTASARAAAAIADYLGATRAVRIASHRSRLRDVGRAAALAIAVGAGWMSNEALTGLSARAEAEPLFVEEAVTSYRTGLIRAAMKSQPEVREFDPVEIRKATGIVLPAVPRGVSITDVQVYPSETGPSVQVAMLTARGEPVSLVAIRGETPAGHRPLLESYKGAKVAYWEEGDFAYGVVGDLPAKRLLQLAAEMSREAASD